MKTGERFNQNERARLVMLELLLHAEWLDEHLGRFPCSAEIAAREFLGLPQLPMPDGSDPLAAPLPAPAAATEKPATLKCAHDGCDALAAEIHRDETGQAPGGWYGFCRPCERYYRVPHFGSCKHGKPAAAPVAAEGEALP
jgi:hypothetical protein